ncbi:MAG: hypothetical protein RR751_02125 [Clostridia bacterium]
MENDEVKKIVDDWYEANKDNLGNQEDAYAQFSQEEIDLIKRSAEAIYKDKIASKKTSENAGNIATASKALEEETEELLNSAYAQNKDEKKEEIKLEEIDKDPSQEEVIQSENEIIEGLEKGEITYKAHSIRYKTKDGSKIVRTKNTARCKEILEKAKDGHVINGAEKLSKQQDIKREEKEKETLEKGEKTLEVINGVNIPKDPAAAEKLYMEKIAELHERKVSVSQEMIRNNEINPRNKDFVENVKLQKEIDSLKMKCVKDLGNNFNTEQENILLKEQMKYDLYINKNFSKQVEACKEQTARLKYVEEKIQRLNSDLTHKQISIEEYNKEYSGLQELREDALWQVTLANPNALKEKAELNIENEKYENRSLGENHEYLDDKTLNPDTKVMGERVEDIEDSAQNKLFEDLEEVQQSSEQVTESEYKVVNNIHDRLTDTPEGSAEREMLTQMENKKSNDIIDSNAEIVGSNQQMTSQEPSREAVAPLTTSTEREEKNELIEELSSHVRANKNKEEIVEVVRDQEQRDIERETVEVREITETTIVM